MFRRWAVLTLCFSFIVTFTACANKYPIGSQTDKSEGNKILVSVTFNAMKEFVEAVGGDRVEISTIIPDGTEPHDFEPKAKDLEGINKARIFVYNGLGMEAWVDDTIAAAGNKELIVVEASSGAAPITNEDALVTEHSQNDPHIWLSLKGAAVEVKNIKNALIEADPANKDYYEENCSDFLKKLDALYNEYVNKFSSLKQKSFVTGHAAFAYLCRDFGLEQHSIEDVFAEGEPSPRQLAALVDYCIDNNVTAIFAEGMASPEVSKTLADEVGAQVRAIYTIEGSDDNKNYLDRMAYNLLVIYEGMSN